MTYYIVRNLDQNLKYMTRTTSLIDALKVYDEAKANGTRVDLTAKKRNQLIVVTTAEIEAARAKM